MRAPIDSLIDSVVKCNACGGPYARDCKCLALGNDGEIPRATHSGDLYIGGIQLEVHILSDGQRVIDAESIRELIEGLG